MIPSPILRLGTNILAREAIEAISRQLRVAQDLRVDIRLRTNLDIPIGGDPVLLRRRLIGEIFLGRGQGIYAISRGKQKVPLGRGMRLRGKGMRNKRRVVIIELRGLHAFRRQRLHGRDRASAPRDVTTKAIRILNRGLG